MKELEALKRRYEGRTPGLMGARQNYAVLCPFVEVEGEVHLLFEVRAKGLRQEGEVCFPGGRVEEGESFERCALRETEEELGIPPSEIAVFGESDFQASQEKMLLRSFLGEVSPAGLARLRPAAAEVAEVFTVPLRFFRETDPEVYTYDLMAQLPEDFPYEAVGAKREGPWQGGRVSVPVWYYEGHVIWGLTGRIVRDILGK